jgi:flagellar basal-body rod protein FlgB
MSFLDTTQLALEAAMSGSMQRQTLLTNNLANADTPDYQPEDVDFQGQLQNAIQSGQSLSSLTFQPVTEPQSVGADGNGVDSNQTSAEIAENSLLYQTMSEVAGQREEILKTAMGLG